MAAAAAMAKVGFGRHWGIVVGMGLSGTMTAKKKERVSIVLRRFGMGLPLQYLLNSCQLRAARKGGTAFACK